MVKTKSRPNCANSMPVAPTAEDQIDAALSASIEPPPAQPPSLLPSFSPYDLAKLACSYDRRCDEIQEQISQLVHSAPSERGDDVSRVVADGKHALRRLRLEEQDKLWSARCMEVEDLVPLFPALSLADAAVQLSYALRTLDRIHDEQSGAENASLAEKAEQLVLWAFEAVAGASERPLNDVMDLWPFKRLADARGEFDRADAISRVMLESPQKQTPYFPPPSHKSAQTPVAQAYGDYRNATAHSRASLEAWDGCNEPQEEMVLETVWTEAFTAREKAVERLMRLRSSTLTDVVAKAEAALDLVSDETSTIRDAGLEGDACIRVVEDLLHLVRGGA
ncbi:hypothetical protein HW537_10835 [Asaia siamensis]